MAKQALTTKKTPQVGDFGLTRIGGVLGFLITIGQALIGDGSRYTHVFVVVSSNGIVEAMPGGAILSPIKKYEGRAVYCELPLTEEQRDKVATAALGLIGTPYSFLDYLSLALFHWHIRPEWLKNYIKNKGHMICSQLADEAELRGGFHLFNDDRLPQDVTPGDIANGELERDWL